MMPLKFWISLKRLNPLIQVNKVKLSADEKMDNLLLTCLNPLIQVNKVKPFIRDGKFTVLIYCLNPLIQVNKVKLTYCAKFS